MSIFSTLNSPCAARRYQKQTIRASAARSGQHGRFLLLVNAASAGIP
jgi:hypothetical protein